jgi:fumarylacetoacetase
MTRNETHDPKLKSWVQVEENSHFPIQNLPYGIFCKKNSKEKHICTAIGNHILDLSVLSDSGILNIPQIKDKSVFNENTLNPFMKLGKKTWSETRKAISALLSENQPRLRDDEKLRKEALISIEEVEMQMPVKIGDYTDFYSSKEHATNVGTMFRGKENALMPNWTHLPVAYHGRSSSIILSGQEVTRPIGQSKADDKDLPSFGPTKLLDFELEMGFFIGTENEMGSPIPVEEAENHIFGLALVNDWSARDIQKWEYQPLGPFLAKNFATSISPWIVSLEALEPFRCEGPKQSPEPLPYLRSKGPGLFDINLEVHLQGENMNEAQRICSTNFKNMYWNMQQQLAHHSITGCNMQTGDLLASGTISGEAPDSRGSMLELAWRGSQPLTFPNGETRKFIQDGDSVTITGWSQGNHYRIGFGEVTGKIIPSKIPEMALA